jgi:hypothetical protein
MNDVIMDGICSILNANKKLLRIPIRQKAKFEGWLKFELAGYLEQQSFKEVEVETKGDKNQFHTDITFYDNEYSFYSVELKTANTNWIIPGIRNSGKPITKNINSIIDDCLKMNSNQGIVAFVLFPILSNDTRWEVYLERIIERTGIKLNKKTHCRIIQMEIDDNNKCDLLVCTFISKSPIHKRWF